MKFFLALLFAIVLAQNSKQALAQETDGVDMANLSDGKCATLLIWLLETEDIAKGGQGASNLADLSKFDRGALVSAAIGFFTSTVIARDPDKKLGQFMAPTLKNSNRTEFDRNELDPQECGLKLIDIGERFVNWGQELAPPEIIPSAEGQ